MDSPLPRRRFVTGAMSAAAMLAVGPGGPDVLSAQSRVSRTSGTRVRLGLNAYSFNEPLHAGTMTLDDRAGYRGFLPIETLGTGDPKVKVAAFLAAIRRHFT